MSASTVQAIIDAARIRHWSFTDVQMPDGAIVAYLDDRQRKILLAIIKAVEALQGETSEVTTDLVGATLIALDDNGNPYYTTTVEDGYVIRFNSNNVPYVDTSTPFILDPFGSSGSVPGFPLPDDLLRLTSVTAISTQQQNPVRPLEVNIIEQRNADARGGSLQLRAYISAARIVPVRSADTDPWSTVTSLRISMVRCPRLTSMTDLITLPTACEGALTAAAAEMLATASRTCSEPDKRRFESQRKEADALLVEEAENILDSITTSGVVVRGR